MNKYSRLLRSFLPGLFLVSYNVGIGSVTMMSKSGALYGCSLLWIVLLSSVIYYYLVSVFSKYTMVTRETFLYAVKKHISRKVSLFIIGAICLIIYPALMGLMGIMCDVLSEWSVSWGTGKISSSVWGFVLASLVAIFFLLGTTEKIKSILSGIVVIIFFAFVANLFYAFPPASTFFKGLIPTIPEDIAGSDNGTFLIMAGMVGTTVSSIAFIIRSSLVKEANWDFSYYRQQKKDALLSAIGVFLISAAILVSATATLYVNDLTVNSAVDLILLLKPIVGEASIVFMSIGILAAGITSHIPNIMVIPWVVSDYKSVIFDMKNTKNRCLLIFLTFIGVLTPVFHWKPVFIMLLSQGLLAVLLPLTVGCIYYLMNNKIMKDDRNNLKDNILLGIVFLFTLFIGGLGLVGLIKDIV